MGFNQGGGVGIGQRFGLVLDVSFSATHDPGSRGTRLTLRPTNHTRTEMNNSR